MSTILVNRHCFSGLIDPGSAARSLGPPAYGCFIFSPFLPLPLRLPSTRCHPHAPTSSFVFASRILLYMDRIPTEGPASASLRSHASFPSLRSPPCRRRRPGKQACCTYMHMKARSAQCIRLRAVGARCLRVPSGVSCHPARRCSSRVVRNPAAPRAASASSHQTCTAAGAYLGPVGSAVALFSLFLINFTLGHRGCLASTPCTNFSLALSRFAPVVHTRSAGPHSS